MFTIFVSNAARTTGVAGRSQQRRLPCGRGRSRNFGRSSDIGNRHGTEMDQHIANTCMNMDLR